MTKLNMNIINDRENLRAINNGQSRETGKIGHTRHQTKTNTANITTQKAKKMSNTDHTMCFVRVSVL